ncbi:MAG: TonB-dependent receptor [Deltaproteobacteria bacterium]|nr:TonB-dependent receptor [Deltaproteobacteria bacterium]
MRGAMVLLPCLVLALAARAEEAAIEEPVIDEAALEEAFDFESLDDLNLMDEFALLEQEDVVVTASRRAQRLDDSPSAITVFTRKDLLAMPFDNIADLLRMVPGVDVLHLTIAYPAVGARSGTTLAGSNVLVLIDGRDVLNPLFQLPVWIGLPVDIGSIERIEIIRGPASTLYGAGALQGVVNIVTRRAEEKKLQAEVSLGGYRPETLVGDLRIFGRSGAFSWWSAWGYDQRAPFYEPDRVGASSFRSRSWVRYEGEKVEATLELGGGVNGGDMVTVAGIGEGRFDQLYLRSEAIVHETRIRFFVDRVNARFDLDLNLRFPSDPEIVMAQLPQPIRHPTTVYELSAERAWRIGERLRVLGGFQGKMIHHREGTMVTCAPSLPTNFDPSTCEANPLVELRPDLYGQLEWQVMDDLDLNLGVRAGLNNLVREPGFAPRLSAVYRASAHHTFRASAARAYRKPSFFELQGHVLLEPGTMQDEDLLRRLQHIFAVNLGNADLQNAKVDIAELGWRGRFLGDALRVEVELYASRYLDDVVLDVESLQKIEYFAGLPIIGDEVAANYLNDPDPTGSIGAELTATWRPAEDLELLASYHLDYVNRRVVGADGARIWQVDDQEPQHRILGGARYLGRNLRLSLDAMWVSGFWEIENAPESLVAPSIRRELGANTLLAGRVGWAFELGGTRWEAGVYGQLPVLGLEMRETAGSYLPDGSNNFGHPLKPRAQGYLRGAF